MPAAVQHQVLGSCELRLLDTEDAKIAWYRNGFLEIIAYSADVNWDRVYHGLYPYLKGRGFV